MNRILGYLTNFVIPNNVSKNVLIFTTFGITLPTYDSPLTEEHNITCPLGYLSKITTHSAKFS